MEFYTSVQRAGNYILYRGYNNGQRLQSKVPFEPTLYVLADQETGYKTLNGHHALPKVFDTMREAGDFVREHDNIVGYDVYGTTNYVDQFIQDRFPTEIQFNPQWIVTSVLDIEVASDDGFPNVDLAEKPVISISYRCGHDDKYHVYTTDLYDKSKCKVLDPEQIVWHDCTDEYDLFTKFLNKFADRDYSPDVITGWNVRLFDLPYLIHRHARLFGDERVTRARFSPWNIPVRQRNLVTQYGEMTAYDIQGIEQLDYLDLFKKFDFKYGELESYKLDHVAHVVLGRKKLSYEEVSSLHELYLTDFQKFVDYNIVDVELVWELDQKLGLVNQAITMAYRAGVNYSLTFGTTNIWDTIIFRELMKDNKVVPPKRNHSKVRYPGAHVKEPVPAMYNWASSFDLKSLYPSCIIQYNMSPETMLPEQCLDVSLDTLLNGQTPTIPESAGDPDDVIVCPTGVLFTKKYKGVIPSIVERFYAERVQVKKKMIDTIRENEQTPSVDLRNQITLYHNQQMAIKILMNSLYGAMANQYFRYFDNRIAESITTCGQLAIRWAEKAMNEKMNKMCSTENKDFVIAIDTDSLYVNMERLVGAYADANMPDDQIVDALDNICSKVLGKTLKVAYNKLAIAVNAYSNRMEMNREVIANRGVWVAKKRYILNVLDDEGVRLAEPKLKITGLDAIKSSTPEVVRDALKDSFKVIMNGTENDMQTFIETFRSKFYQLEPEQVSFPRGMSNITKWRSGNGCPHKGCPIHVRGAIYYNNLLDENNLETKYEKIKNGDKIKFVYLRLPNPVRQNVISYIDYLPAELRVNKFVDYHTMFDKTFIGPLTPILDAVGWTATPQATDLTSLMG